MQQKQSEDGATVQVEWKPFQIDPGTDMSGEPFEAYCRRRWGSSSWTGQLRTTGKNDGADFGSWKWWPNTLRAHQFIQYGVSRYGLSSDDLNATLFRAIYEEGKNISLTETLVAIGRDVLPECDPEDLRTYLEENKGSEEVQQQIYNGRKMYNISSVPFFVVGLEGSKQAPYGLRGAQSAESFAEIFDELAGV